MKENLPFQETTEKERGSGSFFDLREVEEKPNVIIKEFKPEQLENYQKSRTEREVEVVFGDEKTVEGGVCFYLFY